MMLAVALAKRNQNTNYIINYKKDKKDKKDKKEKVSGFILCIYKCKLKKLWN